jgi:hypothetical protein
MLNNISINHICNGSREPILFMLTQMYLAKEILSFNKRVFEKIDLYHLKKCNNYLSEHANNIIIK